MKKLILGASVLLLSVFARSQGLENVIVEKYYISDANDATLNSTGGVLPVGSVTYRVYVDMLPGYKFQAAYGVDAVPKGGAPGPGDHELRFETSTVFFNNIDRGTTSANGVPKNQLLNNTIMLDSWLSVGAASSGTGVNSYFGILKADDDGVGNIVNADGILKNADALAGIPLTTQDGLLAGTVSLSPQAFTKVNIDTEIGVFDDGSADGSLFSTYNGSWASLNGSVGPTADNRVLIAQITTDGIFKFELNIQIGTPTGGVENYVAKNPVGNEIQKASLIYPNVGTGIAKNTPVQGQSLKAYPSPVQDKLAIEIDIVKQNSSNHYAVYDVLGNVILQKDLSTTTAGKYTENIDMSSFPNGIYFIAVSTGGVISSQKVIKN